MDSSKDEKKLSFRRFLKSVWWVFVFYWRLSPVFVVLTLVFTFLLEIEVFVSSYVRAWVIDRLVFIAGEGFTGGYVGLLPMGGVFLGLFVFGGLVREANNYIRNDLRFITEPKAMIFLSDKLKSLGIQSLEQPEVSNLVARSSNHIYQLNQQFRRLISVFSSFVALIASGVIIFHFFPLFVLLIVIVSVPMILVDQYYMAKVWKYDQQITESRRSAYRSLGMLRESRVLQELIITSGYRKLMGHFRDFLDDWHAWRKRVFKGWACAGFFTDVLRILVQVAGYLYVFMNFLLGKITIGLVTFYIQSIHSLSRSIFRLGMDLSSIYESSRRISELREIFELEPVFSDGKRKMKKLKRGPEIEFKNVSFVYPGSKKEVIKDLNLKINSGEKVAIVGHNGAGKTTLVKLLCRFYQVGEGKLEVNGVDINTLSIDSWYKNVGVLFQEYNTYRHLSARDNILIGDIGKKDVDKRVVRAAKKADAHDFISKYERKYDQVLSEKFKGGVRPSTGEWQKIAIARFFYRNAPLVIFDEPTAAIDAVSEKKIFDRIYGFFKKKTVIIISHRFSTVRNADRIVVFEKGRIIEHGSHRELVDLNGTYAKAFRLQAEGYSS